MSIYKLLTQHFYLLSIHISYQQNATSTIIQQLHFSTHNYIQRGQRAAARSVRIRPLSLLCPCPTCHGGQECQAFDPLFGKWWYWYPHCVGWQEDCSHFCKFLIEIEVDCSCGFTFCYLYASLFMMCQTLTFAFAVPLSAHHNRWSPMIFSLFLSKQPTMY